MAAGRPSVIAHYHMPFITITTTDMSKPGNNGSNGLNGYGRPFATSRPGIPCVGSSWCVVCKYEAVRTIEPTPPIETRIEPLADGALTARSKSKARLDPEPRASS